MKASEHIEQVATTVADKVTLGGASTGVLGWIMNNNVLGLIGVCIALAGFLVNWYYKHKHYKLAEKQLELGNAKPD